MSDQRLSRRNFLQSASLAAGASAVTFFGPWRHNRIYAAKTDKPLRLGLRFRAPVPPARGTG